MARASSAAHAKAARLKRVRSGAGSRRAGSLPSRWGCCCSRSRSLRCSPSRASKPPTRSSGWDTSRIWEDRSAPPWRAFCCRGFGAGSLSARGAARRRRRTARRRPSCGPRGPELLGGRRAGAGRLLPPCPSCCAASRRLASGASRAAGSGGCWRGASARCSPPTAVSCSSALLAGAGALRLTGVSDQRRRAGDALRGRGLRAALASRSRGRRARA